MLQFFMIVAGLLALALYGVIQGFTSGRFNKWANAKSMHYTRSKESWTWVSIFPSQVYTNQDLLSQQVTYRVVDGVLDGAPPSPTELHGFQIASSAFGILTNISSNVYIAALVLIYALSAFDAGILGFNKTSKLMETPVYFTWGSVLVGILFVAVNFFTHFSSWNEERWGSTGDVDVKYSWEAGASLLYASVALWLYIIHVNVKNRIWYALVPDVEEYSLTSDSEPQRSWIGGTQNTGPVDKESTVMFAVSFFLLTMTVLGDTRSTVLETEVQLVILCALGLSMITIISGRVRTYFEYVRYHFLNPSNQKYAGGFHEEQSIWIEWMLVLVEGITIAVSGALFSITFHTLATMYDSSDTQLFYWVFLITTAIFLVLRIIQIISYGVNGQTTGGQKSYKKWEFAYFAHYLLSMVVIVIVLYYVQLSPNEEFGRNLRERENMQYLAMTNVESNTVCGATGVQFNNILSSLLDFKDKKYSEVPMDHNPVSFKVFAWTRWWQMQPEQGTTQGPGLYFCSLGLEQQFGKCRRQYASIPGNALDDNFGKFVTSIADKNLV